MFAWQVSFGSSFLSFFQRTQERSGCKSIPCGRIVSSNRGPRFLKASFGVALTREREKNPKLAKLVRQRLPQARILELPCITHQVLAGADELVRLLHADGGAFDWVLITSPAAAEVFAQAVRASQGPDLVRVPPVASVGSATSAELQKYSIDVAFTPSRAVGASLGDELPLERHRKARILYPSSAKASNEIERRLRLRAMELEFIRINTYDTVEAVWTLEELETARKQVDIVTFASPSAVNVWVQRVGNALPAVCIGETSAVAAKKAGFRHVHAPENPGLEAWMNTLEKVFQLKRTETGV